MKNFCNKLKNAKFVSKNTKRAIYNFSLIRVSNFSSVSLNINNFNFTKGFDSNNKPILKINKRYYGDVPNHKILVMPALSPSMEKGVLVSWNKKVGDKIEAGDSLAKVETDKATIDFDSTEEGYLAKLLVQDGTKDIPLGAPLAIIVSRQSDVQAAGEIQVNSSQSSTPSSPPNSEPQNVPSTPKTNTNLPPHKVLVMPALSPSMEKGVLVSWNKKLGDKIESGDSLAKVETDKATIDFDSTEEGYLAKFLVQDGTRDIPLGAPLAIIVSRQSDIEAASQIDLNSLTSSTSSNTSQPQEQTTTNTQPQQQPQQQQQTNQSSSSSQSNRNPGERISVSPRAKVVAREKGFNLEDISGTGPSGRVILRDVLSFQPKVVSSTQPTEVVQTTVARQQTTRQPSSDYTELDVTNIRKVTAERLSQSKQTIPHYYLTIDCNVENLLSLRQTLNEKLSKEGTKISLNDMLVKAAALSMRKVPQVNSHWYGDFIRQYNDVHIGVAVDTERGLLVPVIRNAEKRGFAEISNQVKQLAEKAKTNKISLEEIQGGTFTISNLGMFGVNNFSAVINPPQSAILAVGTTEKRLVIKGLNSEGKPNIVESSFLKVTLSCDHRVIDGAVGASWLSHFRSYIEDPITMLL